MVCARRPFLLTSYWLVVLYLRLSLPYRTGQNPLSLWFCQVPWLSQLIDSEDPQFLILRYVSASRDPPRPIPHTQHSVLFFSLIFLFLCGTFYFLFLHLFSRSSVSCVFALYLHISVWPCNLSTHCLYLITSRIYFGSCVCDCVSLCFVRSPPPHMSYTFAVNSV